MKADHKVDQKEQQRRRGPSGRYNDWPKVYGANPNANDGAARKREREEALARFRAKCGGVK